MYPRCASRATLHEGLRKVDEDLAARTRDKGCGFCGGPLDAAGWDRKPRGCDAVPDVVCRRHGLCCRRCRRRTLPPSAVFLGRKVYFGAVILVSITARQRRLVGSTARELRKLFGVSKDTLARWLAFFRTDFPASSAWKRLRGRVSARVRDEELPSALLAEFDHLHGPGEPAAHACLAFVAGGEMQAW
jgi:hypothetical protein